MAAAVSNGRYFTKREADHLERISKDMTEEMRVDFGGRLSARLGRQRKSGQINRSLISRSRGWSSRSGRRERERGRSMSWRD